MADSDNNDADSEKSDVDPQGEQTEPSEQSDEVLSQDEIDALLEGVNEGEVDTEAEATAKDSGPAAVREWKLGSRDYITRVQFPALKVVGEGFSRLGRNSLYNVFRRPVEIAPLDVKMMTFAEFRAGLYEPSSFTMLRSPYMRGSAIAMMEPTLVYRFVDSFFGGQGRAFAGIEGREFTHTDISVIKLAMENLLANFNEAWEPVCRTEFKERSHEVNPQMAQVCGPDELVLVFGFTIELAGSGGQLAFVLPYSMIEPIKDKLEARVDSTAEESRDERFSVRLHEEAMGAFIELVCTLPPRSISLGRVMSLKPGDVLMIDQPSEVTLSAEGIPCLKGGLGRSREYFAFQTQRSVSLEQASGQEVVKYLAVPE